MPQAAHAGVAREVAADRSARRVAEALAAEADPAQAPGRVAGHERVVGHVAGDDRAGADRREPADHACPPTTTAPAPIEQPRRSRIGLTVQSSARASSPARVIARGKRSLVRIAFGPMKTPSSTVTPW